MVQKQEWISYSNKSIVEQALAIKLSCSRIEENLARRAGRLVSQVSAAKGRARQSLLDGRCAILVGEDDTESCQQLQDELETLHITVRHIQEEMEGREADVEALRQRMLTERADYERVIREQAETFDHDGTINTGRTIDQVCNNGH